MKSYLIILFSLIFLSCNGGEKTVKKETSPFTPHLENGVKKLIKIKRAKSSSIDPEYQSICTILISKDKIDNECILILTMMSYVDFQRMTGYTILDNELIVCYIPSEDCSQYLLDANKLITTKKSISNYSQRRNNNIIFDAPSYTYKIEKTGELELIRLLDDTLQ